MEAAELRVGNLVYYKGELFTIDFDSFSIAKSLDPIPLTEDWLFKFGFDKMDSEDSLGMFETKVCFYGFNADFIYNYIIYRKGVWILRTADGDENDKTQFVHQFQNLFFALTGEELEIKAPQPAPL